MKFSKGHIPWNKNKTGIFTEEAIDKIRKAKLGSKNPMFGKQLSVEHIKRIISVHKGKAPYIVTPEIRKKMAKRWYGDLNPNYRGGITKLNLKIRDSLEYDLWRSAVFERDNYTCVKCGRKSGQGVTIILNADHYPKTFASIMKQNNIQTFNDALQCEELWNIINGRTLCESCHRKTPTFAGKKLRE